MRLLVGHDEAVAAFVADHAYPEAAVWLPGYRAFGILREDGALVAGFVFDGWNPAAKRVELSARAITPQAFSPRLIAALGAYPFGQLAVHRVTAKTSVDNRRCRKILKGIGFTEEGTMASWYGPGLHAVMYRTTRPEWERRWGNDLRQAA